MEKRIKLKDPHYLVLTLSIKLSLEKGMQPTSVFLRGEPHDRGAWWASVHMDAKSQTQLSQIQLSTHVSIKLSQVVLVLKNLPANAGDRRDVG